MKRHAILLLAILVLGIASIVPAQAQTTVVNPRIVEFDPSADHAAVGTDGQPLVQRYELRIFTVGSTQPYTTTDLGKPAPETDGKIRVDFSTRISPWPPDGNYEARVAAVGPSGLGVSDPSNQFSLVSSPIPTCTYLLSSQNLSVQAAAGTASLTVTTGSACAWTAASNAAWVAPAAASGTGTATVSVVVAANTATTARTATLTIAGQAVTVTQAGVPACTYSASPTSITNIGASGGSSSVAVTAGSGCSWTATSGVAWASVAPASGSGPAAATITVAANTSTAARTATLTIAGQAVTVTQAGAACTYSASPTSVSNIGASGGSSSVTVTAGSGCSWTASSSVSWASVSPASGTGSGPATITIAENSASTSRSASLTIAGQAVTVSQAAVVPCVYTASPTTLSIPASGGPGTVNVTAGSGCAWTATSEDVWASVSPASASGSRAATITVAPNGSASPRSTTIFVARQAVNVTQSAAACSFSLSATAGTVAAAGGVGTVDVSAGAGCGWTAASGATWVTVSPASGAAGGTVSFSVEPNPAATRSATLTIAGRAYVLTQEGLPCSYTLTPPSISATGYSQTVSVGVTSGAGCTWTASTPNSAWITLATTSGTSNGTVSATLARNSTKATRSGTVVIGGRTCTITQTVPPSPAQPKKPRVR